jgi:hypothetical protein
MQRDGNEGGNDATMNGLFLYALQRNIKNNARAAQMNTLACERAAGPLIFEPFISNGG